MSLLYRGVLYVEVILYSKECNWYTRCCPLNGGVHSCITVMLNDNSGYIIISTIVNDNYLVCI